MGEYEPRDSRQVTGTAPQNQSVDQQGNRQGQMNQSQGNQNQGGQQQPGGQGGQSDQQQQFQGNSGQMNDRGGQGQQSGGSGMAGQAAGGVRGQLREHMEVIGADGVHIGTIDSIEGDRIKLTKRDSGQGSHQGHHHYLPLGLVAGIEGDKVRLSANGDVAMGFQEEQ